MQFIQGYVIIKKIKKTERQLGLMWGVFVETLLSKNIIHNLYLYVNTDYSKNEKAEHETCSKTLSRFEKIKQKKVHSVAIAQKLLAIGEQKRGYLMKACNSEIEVYTCKCCGKVKILNAHLCRDRLCPTCQYLLSVKRYNQMVKTIAAIENIEDYEWRFITLTIRNCAPQNLCETIKEMLRAWDKVCKRRTIKRRLSGWGRSLEITYNKAVGTFHPHIHFLAAFTKGSAPSLQEVSMWWQDALQLDYLPICDIEIPYSEKSDGVSSAVVEAFKYCTKSKEVAEMPLSSFAELVRAVKGVRMLAFGGIVRKARQTIGIIENDVAEQEVIDTDVCCGNKMELSIAKWSFDTDTYNYIERYVR